MINYTVNATKEFSYKWNEYIMEENHCYACSDCTILNIHDIIYPQTPKCTAGYAQRCIYHRGTYLPPSSVGQQKQHRALCTGNRNESIITTAWNIESSPQPRELWALFVYELSERQRALRTFSERSPNVRTFRALRPGSVRSARQVLRLKRQFIRASNLKHGWTGYRRS